MLVCFMYIPLDHVKQMKDDELSILNYEFNQNDQDGDANDKTEL